LKGYFEMIFGVFAIVLSCVGFAFFIGAANNSVEEVSDSIVEPVFAE